MRVTSVAGGRPDAAPVAGRGAYPEHMFPGTGSSTLDAVLEIGIIVVLLISVVLLIRNYRGR